MHTEQKEHKSTHILNKNNNDTTPWPPHAAEEKTLIGLYSTMLKARAFDQRAIALQRVGKIGTYAPIHGQEAIGAAMGAAMLPQDVLIPYYRDYAAQLQRGVSMAELFTYWGGDERGNHFQSGSQDLPISVPIASQCLHAVGVAFAFRYRQEARVAVVSLGDGATSEGDFYEAMNAAACWKLPVVFVINNNQWAISVPLSKQTACATLAQKSLAAGFTGVQVDGNDVRAMYYCLQEKIEQARMGQGPQLIEALTYRLSDHTTADDAKRYQPAQQVKTARANEPIARFNQFLRQHLNWDDAREQALLDDIHDEIQRAVSDYLSTPMQSICTAFDYHYATLPSYLVEQRAEAIEEEHHHE